MQRNPVGWFEIYVQDMARARRFYEAVLQRELSSLPNGGLEMLVFPMEGNAPGASGALVHMPGMASGGNSTLVYFSSADCAVEAARVADAGGRVFREKMSIGPYGFIVLVLDPDGNMFGVHSIA